MLAFIDESYQQLDAGPIWTGLAAVCLCQETSRDIARELFKLKRRFWKVSGPDEIELKGSRLLGTRGIQSPRNRDFVFEVLSLCKLYDITPFAVAQESTEGLSLERLKDSGILPDLHRGILRRVYRFMSDRYPKRQAVLAFDERNRQDNRRISRAFRNYLFKSREGQELDQLVETPFFYDSCITPAGEIADIVAYLMCTRYATDRNRTDPPLEEFFTRFRELTYNPQANDWSDKRLWGVFRLGS
ncbi:MAG: DUF3800 domain-containing protein [Planctomycetota bacterium]